jgi:hypothetical protein
MTTYTVPRTGRAPLNLTAQAVASAVGAQHAGREHKRWHDLALYRTARGQYVASVQYHTGWRGELGHAVAEVFDNLAGALRWLEGHDPTSYVAGFKPLPVYKKRQAALLADIRARYLDRVSAILSQLEVEERVP